jgi:aldehyde dehydrogenase (NAD+)
MEDTSREIIETLLQQQRQFFATHRTKEVTFRLEMLKKFELAIKMHEARLKTAFMTDLHKSPAEAYMTEIGLVLGEIRFQLKHLKSWAKPKSARTPLALFPSTGRVIQEPLGVALIMAPWNYPFMLLMNAVAGAISAGCCAILKPSPYTPNVAKVMQEMIAETFDPGYLAMVQGSRKVNEILLAQRFDFIFFTGSPAVGKVVMKAASEHLTPVVLELGGKSPCIVDYDANIDIAAKRIAFGKNINAGQTCIAPDYLFVHHSVKDELIRKIDKNVREMYGSDTQKCPVFPRIVNLQAFDRLEKLMQHGVIRYGGKTDRADRFIEPTIIDDVKPTYPIMQEEIFGPLLPVMAFNDIDEVISYINNNEKPLAFYYFGKKWKAKNILQKTTSGGGCINDTLIHFAHQNLPFGGVGNSGLGKYHGKQSFLAFSNQRSIVQTTTLIDLPFRYAPFKYINFIKRLL